MPFRTKASVSRLGRSCGACFAGARVWCAFGPWRNAMACAPAERARVLRAGRDAVLRGYREDLKPHVPEGETLKEWLQRAARGCFLKLSRELQVARWELLGAVG